MISFLVDVDFDSRWRHISEWKSEESSSFAAMIVLMLLCCSIAACCRWARLNSFFADVRCLLRIWFFPGWPALIHGGADIQVEIQV